VPLVGASAGFYVKAVSVSSLQALRGIRLFLFQFVLSINRINPKKERNSLLFQRKAVLLQADYYHIMIRD